MTLYVVDAHEDHTSSCFSLYLVRSSSREAAVAAVESVLVKVEKVVAVEAQPELQGIMADLPPDTPVHLSDHETTWLPRS